MPFLETCLTILDIADRATKLYDWFTGVSSGDQMNATINTLAREKSDVYRLSDRILYAPHYQQAINQQASHNLNDEQRIYDLLNPVAEALDTDLLVSAVVSTPEKLRQAFRKNPWELLTEVRPAHRTKKPNNPDLVPISFYDNNTQYIGWQTRAALPLLFNCDFESEGTSLILPSEKIIERTPFPPSVENTDPFEAELLQWFSANKNKEGFYCVPRIPNLVFSNALSNCKIKMNEKILAVIDCTLEHSGKYCLVFGLKGIYYHNPRESDQPGTHFIPYEEFPHRQFSKPWFFEISLDGGSYLNCVSSSMSRADILIILERVTKIVKRYMRW